MHEQTRAARAGAAVGGAEGGGVGRAIEWVEEGEDNADVVLV